MAFANSSISDLIATTIEKRSKVLADNLTKNNALLDRLNRKGNVQPFGGGTYIMEQIFYDDTNTNNAAAYSGYEVLNISPDSPISGANFDIKQYSSVVSMSGLEQLKNSSTEQIVDLLAARMKISEARLSNKINVDLFLDGTANAGKSITGLAAAIPDNPATGTYGGIDRSVWSFWRPSKFSGTSDGGAAITSANIAQYMTKLSLGLVRNNDMPDVCIADSNYYGLYANSLQSIQRITDDGSKKNVGAGFTGLKFYGGGGSMDVVMASGIGSPATANHMWMINTNFMHFRPHKDRNFVPIGGDRQSVNQDAIVRIIGWAGNLTCTGQQFHGVLIA